MGTYRAVLAAVADDRRLAPRKESAATNDGDRTLDMPFSDIFALKPVNIRYIAGLLGVLSHMYPEQANEFGPLFGVRDKSLVDPEAMVATAGLIASISNMDPGSLSVISSAIRSNSNGPRDSLIENGSLFALSDVLTMEPKRVHQAAHFFNSVARLKAPEMQKYLQDIGWVGHGIARSASDGTLVLPVPNLSLMFPMSDESLQSMANAARSYSGRASSETRLVRPTVEKYLKDARDFFDAIPALSSLSALSPAANPIIAALTQIISMSYLYPNESYWALAWRYYQGIGMPGISWISAYPSQVIGGFASSLIGGYVSGAISDAVVGLIGNSGATSTAALAKPSSSPAATPKPASASTTSGGGGGFWGGLFSALPVVTSKATGSSVPAPMAPTHAPVATASALAPAPATSALTPAATTRTLAATTRTLAVTTRTPAATTRTLAATTHAPAVTTSRTVRGTVVIPSAKPL
ncbi:hypothetical protein LPJ61_004696 [Coemansia biformis]|uniref:Uncharacterized protein n=1 Tax=Coemansia biformis TaxID=1286918 RepID=A0A9W7Y839_9FUNG|nr:hypothetical protein LPJ61_004696 [Coemansia biformis]